MSTEVAIHSTVAAASGSVSFGTRVAGATRCGNVANGRGIVGRPGNVHSECVFVNQHVTPSRVTGGNCRRVAPVPIRAVGASVVMAVADVASR